MSKCVGLLSGDQGIFGSFLDNTVNTWVLKVKGPVYVAMFKPLSIVIAVVMGVVFLGDTLYLGRYILSLVLLPTEIEIIH